MSDERGKRDREDADAAELSGSDETADRGRLSRPSGKRSGRSRSGGSTIEAAERRGTVATSPDAERDDKSVEATAGSAGARTKKSGKGRSGKGRGDRGNIFVRVITFLRQVISELKKVIWPNRNEMVTYTTVVLIFVVFVVAVVAGLDIGFAKAVMWLFG